MIAVGAPIYFRGERFGQLVERMLPDWRGRVHVGGGHWNWGTVIALVRGRPAAIAFEDITITDPEGTEVLHIEHVSARIEAHRKPTRIIIHDLDIKDARWRYARMKGENKIGFLAAFESIPRKVRKKPSKPTSSEFSIVGRAPRRDRGHLRSFGPGASCCATCTAPARSRSKGRLFTFEVKDADVRGGGRLRILGEKSGIVLPIDRGRIDRVAHDRRRSGQHPPGRLGRRGRPVAPHGQGPVHGHLRHHACVEAVRHRLRGRTSTMPPTR